MIGGPAVEPREAERIARHRLERFRRIRKDETVAAGIEHGSKIGEVMRIGAAAVQNDDEWELVRIGSPRRNLENVRE